MEKLKGCARSNERDGNADFWQVAGDIEGKLKPGKQYHSDIPLEMIFLLFLFSVQAVEPLAQRVRRIG